MHPPHRQEDGENNLLLLLLNIFFQWYTVTIYIYEAYYRLLLDL